MIKSEADRTEVMFLALSLVDFLRQAKTPFTFNDSLWGVWKFLVQPCEPVCLQVFCMPAVQYADLLSVGSCA